MCHLLLHTPSHSGFDRIALISTGKSLRIFHAAPSISYITCNFVCRRLKMRCSDTNCVFGVSTIVSQCSPIVIQWKMKKNEKKARTDYPNPDPSHSFHFFFFCSLSQDRFLFFVEMEIDFTLFLSSSIAVTVVFRLNIAHLRVTVCSTEASFHHFGGNCDKELINWTCVSVAMHSAAGVFALCVCMLAHINGFSFCGRTNFNSKSSLQMNDIRKTENKRDRSLAGILGAIDTRQSLLVSHLIAFLYISTQQYINNHLWLHSPSLFPSASVLTRRICWIHQKNITTTNSSHGGPTYSYD